MSNTSPPPTPRRSLLRRWLLPSVVIVVVGVVAWWAIDERSAHNAFRRGQAALQAGNYADARTEFARCLKTWPHRADVWFAAARAARLAGDLKSADNHILEAGALGELPERVVLEKSLIALKRGEPFAAHEKALRIALTHPTPSASEALNGLAKGYIGQFRLIDAEALTATWLERWPDDVTVWQYRTNVLERLNRKELMRAASAEWVRRAPDDLAARLTHVRFLLDARVSNAELAPHLEWLRATAPHDGEGLQYCAKAAIAEGQLEEAASLLDRAIAVSRMPTTALTERAKLELDRGKPEAALPFARRAVAADPSAVEAAYTLLRSLQQTGATTEAEVVEAKWKQIRADLDAANAVGKRLLAEPYNPDFRREMGELLIKNGRIEDGLRWLESALALAPNHAPTHRYLANFYAGRGQRELAERHRIQGIK